VGGSVAQAEVASATSVPRTARRCVPLVAPTSLSLRGPLCGPLWCLYRLAPDLSK
jgi:hypothetical protein